MSDEVFTQKELDKLIFAAIDGNGGECSKEKIVQFVDLCAEMRISGNLVDLLLKGKVKADIRKSASEPNWELAENEPQA
jgi:hypothetical protein